MTEYENDSLSALLPDWNLNNRVVTWLWLKLITQAKTQLEECQLNSQTMRNQIARALKEDRRLIRRFKADLDTHLLPEQTFNWIEKNGRQPKWLAAEVAKKTEIQIRSSVFHSLTKKEQLIALLDLWDEGFSHKDRTLRRLAFDWTMHMKADRIFNWFKDKDERAKCALAWSWLEKNNPQLTLFAAPFTKLNELLDFFDHCGAFADEKELYIEKIKRRWNTQKTREKATEKKQYNFVLTHSVNAILDKLAEEHELSRTKVLQKLLLSEAEQGLYLSSRTHCVSPL